MVSPIQWQMFKKQTKNITEIGQTLKKLRESKGLTQEEVAALIHISRYCVSRIETGDRKEIDTLLIAKYAALLGISMDDLVYCQAA